MPLPPVLAHGALGAFDELIYLGIAAIFVVIMAISWLRSRNATLDDDTDDTHEDPKEIQNTPERFKLE